MTALREPEAAERSLVNERIPNLIIEMNCLKMAWFSRERTSLHATYTVIAERHLLASRPTLSLYCSCIYPL
jgi:hypothetical protein